MTEGKRYSCSCGKKILIPAEMTGKSLKCPRCGKRLAPNQAVHAAEAEPQAEPASQRKTGGAATGRRGAVRSSTSRRSKRTGRGGASKGRNRSERAPKALDAARGAPAEDASEGGSSTRKPRSTRRAAAAAPKGESRRASTRSGRAPSRRQATGRSPAAAPDSEATDRSGGSSRTSRRTAAPTRRGKGVRAAGEGGGSTRRAAAPSRRRRAADLPRPAGPGIFGLVGLVGSTFQLLTGALISVSALSSPDFLKPAGFVVGESATVYVLLFGVIFFLGGVATAFSLFRYIRDSKRAEDISVAESLEAQPSEMPVNVPDEESSEDSADDSEEDF